MVRIYAIKKHLNIENIVDRFYSPVHRCYHSDRFVLCCVHLPFFDRSFIFDSNGQISGMCREYEQHILTHECGYTRRCAYYNVNVKLHQQIPTQIRINNKTYCSTSRH